MRGFKSAAQVQRFLSVHGLIRNLFGVARKISIQFGLISQFASPPAFGRILLCTASRALATCEFIALKKAPAVPATAAAARAARLPLNLDLRPNQHPGGSNVLPP